MKSEQGRKEEDDLHILKAMSHKQMERKASGKLYNYLFDSTKKLCQNSESLFYDC